MAEKKVIPEIIELGQFLESFNKESDRGAVLIAASILDEWLSEILESFLLDDKVSKELLFGFNAPLGTFSARIKTSYALGLIEEKEYCEINIIRRIRNVFGHSWRGVDFASSRIKEECDKLDWVGPKDEKIPRTARNKFNFSIAILLSDLIWRKKLVLKNRVVKKRWPSKTR